MAQTFAAWGIRTLGQLAALPTKSLVARVGQSGFRLQAQARGEYSHLLVPAEEPADAALCESMELEHPVELLEPCSFCSATCWSRLPNAPRSVRWPSPRWKPAWCLNGTAPCGARPKHRRTVRPALPERDRHTLLKLIQLDLELHPPDAAVIALRVKACPARPQTAQQGLFAAQAPEAGRMEILLARLRNWLAKGAWVRRSCSTRTRPRHFESLTSSLAGYTTVKPHLHPASTLRRKHLPTRHLQATLRPCAWCVRRAPWQSTCMETLPLRWITRDGASSCNPAPAPGAPAEPGGRILPGAAKSGTLCSRNNPSAVCVWHTTRRALVRDWNLRLR